MYRLPDQYFCIFYYAQTKMSLTNFPSELNMQPIWFLYKQVLHIYASTYLEASDTLYKSRINF